MNPNPLKDEWGTPPELFWQWNKEFDFTLDPCASRKSPSIFRKPGMLYVFKDSPGVGGGLSLPWDGHRVYVNPPYSGNQLFQWCYKCYQEKDSIDTIILLVPARICGTEYFHHFILPYAEVAFLQGRINFIPLIGQNVKSNPQYSILCVFQGEKSTLQCGDWREFIEPLMNE